MILRGGIVHAAGVRIVPELIPYPQIWLAEMAAYSQRHYGVAKWRLTPRVIA